MPARFVNLAILVLVLAEVASGVGSFLVATENGRWVFWAHAIGGLALVVLLPWKWRIAERSYVRRGPGLWALLPSALAGLALAALGTGLLWATFGLPDVELPGVIRTSGLTLHVILGLAIVPLLLIHAALRWPRPRRADFAGRRAALRTLGLAGAGLVLWRGVEALTDIASLSGSRRRFTGSREEGSFQGNAHPLTNWLSDPRPRIEADEWRLRVGGRVERELRLTYEEVLALAADERRALLDCTGGWYTVQDWSGIRMQTLLQRAGIRDGARSIVVRSHTGYERRFDLDDAGTLLLATHVTGDVLSRGHGYPMRLVAPGSRGFDWVKWVTDVEVSDAHPLWEPPLPLQ